MRIDPLVYVSRAIDAALEAVMVPAVILLAAVLVIAATMEIRARWRRGGSQAATTMPTAARRGNRARGAEA